MLLLLTFASGSKGAIDLLVEPERLVGEDDDLEEEKGDTDEAEAEDLTTLESSHEAVLKILHLRLNIGGRFLAVGGLSVVSVLDVVELDEHVKIAFIRLLIGDHGIEPVTLAALVGGSSVGVSGDGHANPASKNGGEGTNEEGDSSVGEVGGGFLLVSAGHLMVVNSETDEDGKDGAEEQEVSVLSFEEVVGTLIINLIRNCN